MTFTISGNFIAILMTIQIILVWFAFMFKKVRKHNLIRSIIAILSWLLATLAVVIWNGSPPIRLPIIFIIYWIGSFIYFDFVLDDSWIEKKLDEFHDKVLEAFFPDRDRE